MSNYRGARIHLKTAIVTINPFSDIAITFDTVTNG